MEDVYIYHVPLPMTIYGATITKDDDGLYTYCLEEEKDRSARRKKTNAIRIENALPVIIGRAQFTEVQKIMSERKQTGKKGGYLCSGLVYCECGAKMHGMTSQRKGHEYQYFVCSKKCGAPVIRMEDINRAAIKYLHKLLTPENQEKIATALRQYQAGEGSRTIPASSNLVTISL